MQPDDEVIDLTIDTTKAINVPGTPPGACPSCRRQFSQVLKPPRRLQYKAKLMIVFGFCLSIAWAAVLWLAVQQIANRAGGMVIHVNIITGALALIVIAAPAYLVALFAMRLAREVKLVCPDCGWQQKYLVDGSGKVMREL